MLTDHWKIWIDTGGTFTDCIASGPSGEYKRLKVLSSSLLRTKILSHRADTLRVSLSFRVSKDFLSGFYLRIGNETTRIRNYSPETQTITLERSLPENADFAEIFTHEEVPVFAARILTETGLSEHFPPLEMSLGSTRGTNALLERKGARTAFLVTKGFKDLLLIGNQQRPDLFARNIQKEKPLYEVVMEVDERVEADGTVLHTLHPGETERLIGALKKRKIQSVAVALLNSYRNSIHEAALGNALKRAGFDYVSLSHQLSSQIKITPRAETTVANGYLHPIIHQYVSGIQKGLASSSIKIMSSAGGLLPASDFQPKDSLLSGPAGGVIGAITKGFLSGVEKIITFDMGGTSTDVSLCNGRPDYRFDCTVGTLKILSPSLAIETIAAGGGSICDYDGYRFTVGPHSAGASPGPACYGAGGPLTITDVNLLLGRLDEANFSIPINRQHAQKKLDELLLKVKKNSGKRLSPKDALHSFAEIANEKMAEAIRKVSIQQGHDPKEYSLLCFGGAGGQHACALASMLSIGQVIVPYDAGLLSAFGISHATSDRVKERLVLKSLSAVLPQLEEIFSELFEEAKAEIEAETREGSVACSSRLIFLRLKGQETSLEIEYDRADLVEQQFIDKYKKVYGHWLADREIEVESVRVIASRPLYWARTVVSKPKKKKANPSKRSMYPVYRWEDLSAGATLNGPSLVISNNSTLFVEAGWNFFLDENNNAIVKQVAVEKKKTIRSDEAQLELFTNRFTAIAQEMGALLQRTSFSVNVKERLDFSCALLDASGKLIVNAPHIPVHLGSMGVCVREVMKSIEMKPGDVIITNHPAFGGSHLPDITLIKPIFFRKKLAGFVANRAHHAEIGGKKPGSMPADARNLEEEGVVIAPTYLVKRGEPQWEKIETMLTSAVYPTRAVRENLADLNGALAALFLGEEALQSLCETHGLKQVQQYMQRLHEHSTKLIGRKIKDLSSKKISAKEFLDDGSRLQVSISKKKNRLVIDFSGSSEVHPGNLNATKAIVNSVVLYVLRLWVDEPVPLNEGLLKNVSVIIPKGLLDPVFSSDNKRSPAVVGGNTEVSQRLTDTLLKALKLAACSQGTMNNFLFGNERFGYYETICGGTGAGPGFDGAHAVHQHMTNTRITDPEILEFRYPVRLEKFEIRKGSGGSGKWKGGNGVVRELYFKESLDINILSQHRRQQPYGSNGGSAGKTGEQFVIRSNGEKKKLKETDGLTLHEGDRIVIKTPGGGGWGTPKK